MSSQIYSAFAPAVLENTSRGERVWDIPSRLFRDRFIVLSGEINREVATLVCSQILVLQHENPEGEINMIINSPGGEVIAGFAIYDMMQLTTCPISTICVGDACSAASLILAGGTHGKRTILEHSRVLLHQPWGGVKGQVTDIEIQVKDMLRMKQSSIDILHKHTKQPKEKLSADLERDHILYAEEAIKYGIVDKVLTKGSF
jgi:ATP-dependent Clp protease protease subunit